MPRVQKLSMRSVLVRPVLAAVRAAGADPAELIRRFGLPETAESDAEIVLPLATLHALVDAAEAVTRDPFLGLHLAMHYPRGVFRLLEFASRSSPTLREAFARVVRYASLANELVVVTLSDGADGVVVLDQRIPGVPLCVGRHLNEFLISALLLQARLLSGDPCIPERVWFAHPKPPDVTELEAVLGTRAIQFDMHANGFALRSSALEVPLATSDPALLSFLDQHGEHALGERAAPDRFVGRVRQLVREALPDGAPTLVEISRRLRMSQRTVQRRLADQGTSVVDLLDSVRQELGREHVADRQRALGEIAFLLGYTDTRAFLRAFKRWTGMTPAQFRTQRRPE